MIFPHTIKINNIEVIVLGYNSTGKRVDNKYRKTNVPIFIIKCILCKKPKSLSTYSLQNGKCLAHSSCRRNEQWNNLSDEIYIGQVISFMYARTKNSAKIRKMKFTLTREDIANLIFLNCHYCGVEPEQTYRTLVKTFNGIDRKNNNEGYTIDNCLPCCMTCNYGKRDMPYNNFIKYLDRIILFRKNTGEFNVN